MKRIRLIFCFIALFSFGTSFGQNEVRKADLIRNIATIVNWPASMHKGNIVIGIFGNPIMAMEMRKVADKVYKINGQIIAVKSFGSVSEISNCHVLYVATSKSSLLGQVITTLGKANTLVITDSPGLCKQGAGINLITPRANFAFEINKANILKQGLTFNDGLLTIGIPVN